MKGSDVNSREYWNDRFREDWEKNEGREQSRFFGRLALDLFPDWLLRAIRVGHWTVADWGCAEGDGTQILAEGLGVAVEGVDFSQEAIERARAMYPDIAFHAEDWLAPDVSVVSKTHDVVFSSNTLEHFHSPWTIFSTLSSRARRFVVLLLPFREFERHYEHFFTFDFDTVRVGASAMHLVHAVVTDTRDMPYTQWPGEQILLVYAYPEEIATLELSYRDLRIDSCKALQDVESLAAAKAENQRLSIERAEGQGKIELLNARLDQADAQLKAINIDRAAWTSRAMAAEAKLEELSEAQNRLVADHEKELSETQSRLMTDHEQVMQSLQQTLQSLEQHIAQRDRGLSGLAWRVQTGVARLRSAILRTRVGRVLSYLRRNGLVRTALNAGSRLYGSRAMTWYAYLFDTFRRSRQELFPVDWTKVQVAVEPGLVTIVLPCFNGEDMVAESIESVLSQSYRHFELILVDDGSSDGTGAIFDSYAELDPRIRVIHQDNQKLPRALNRGFREARGELLTWTSADNRMKVQCLERMVSAFREDAGLDMVYANLDIIGPDGEPLENSPWYSNYQSPPGSEHIDLPRDTSELNIWPNNFIGACFMYRARVAHLIRDYSPVRFCTEDYDYWMRVNSLFRLKHLGINEPLYDYRFHPNSLTSKDKELRITENRTRLMVFEDFRRSFLLSSGIWVLEAAAQQPDELEYIERVVAQLREAGHQVFTPEQFDDLKLSHQWTPVSWLRIASEPAAHAASAPPEVAGMVSILVALRSEALPLNAAVEWTWCVTMDRHSGLSPPRLERPYQGWAIIDGVAQLIASVDVLAKEHQLASIERDAESQHAGEVHASLDATIVICTYKRSASLPAALHSAVAQTMDKERYEVIIVNNEPSERYPCEIVDTMRATEMSGYVEHLRLIDCPIPGLSHARNAGLAASRGEVVLFLDDDAVARPDCLARIVGAYEGRPEIGVVGGHIVLDPPKPAPEALRPGRESLWSHFVTFHEELSVVRHWWEYPWGANWSARREVLYGIGGFRCNYGRSGGDFGGGEELVAASLASQLGYEVAIEPNAAVLHQVEAKRFTDEHVRKTILSGLLVNYQMQKSMHLPFEASLTGTTKAVLHDLVESFKAASRLSRRAGQDPLMASAHRRARRRLWIRQLQDRVLRSKTPVTRR